MILTLRPYADGIKSRLHHTLSLSRTMTGVWQRNMLLKLIDTQHLPFRGKPLYRETTSTFLTVIDWLCDECVMCMWKPEVNIRCVFLSHSLPCSLKPSSHRTWNSVILLGWLISKLQGSSALYLPALGLQVFSAAPDFYIGHGTSNSEPHSCMIITLQYVFNGT